MSEPEATKDPGRGPGRLVLVRHGETEGNVAKLLDTRVPGLPLTERGVAQAKSFAARLAEPPVRLYSSVALRARQTAGHIESGIGVPAEVLDGVHEVQVGELEGSNSDAAHHEFQRIYRSWHIGELSTRLPGGESGEEVLGRYLPVLEQLRADYLAPGSDSRDVLLVSHGAAMRLVARELTGVAPPFTTNNHLDNTETIELVPTAEGGWTCVRWGRYTPPFGYQVEPAADDPMG
ncbi:histidine phosphatase family protein [Nocardia spumae]|uniref:histidine phosphatase family protein n=1 Tax=Nocardia spumae TaxID=2887190 RepID=UPI001D15A9A0|nr:histidine phosphatase family protein [Nocardia spumae]